MKSTICKTIALVSAAVCVLSFPGCSVLGFVIGNGVDNSSEDVTKLNWQDTGLLKPGTEITVIRRNGQVDTGKFLGMVKQSYDEYSMEYTKSRDGVEDDVSFPVLGETISWQSKITGNVMVEQFNGFDLGSLVLQRGNSTQERKVAYEKIEHVWFSNGKSLTGRELDSLAILRSIPLRTKMHIVAPRDTTKISFEDFQFTETPGSKNAKWTGLAIGAAIDCAIIVGASIALSSLGGFGMGTGSFSGFSF